MLAVLRLTLSNMKILSLFDGMSVAQQAISELYKDYKYYASEIDEYAIAVTQSNFPSTKQVGNVSKLTAHTEPFDLLIRGSPCQDLSIAKKDRKGLDGDRSGLFYEYVRIRDENEPEYFILENVASMSKESKDKISEILGVQPIMINASLVSAQNRKRLFWVGKLDEFGTYQQVEIPQPEDRGIMLKDILEDNVDSKYFASQQSIHNNFRVTKNIKSGDEKSKALTATMWKGNGNDGMTTIRVGKFNSGGQGDRVYSQDGKSVALSAQGGGRGAKTGLYAVPVALRNRGQGKQPEYNGTGKANAMTSVQTDSMVEVEQQIRKLTPTECLRLQSLPDNYFDKATYKNKPISNTQRYKMCGNAFNKEVVKHIIQNLK